MASQTVVKENGDHDVNDQPKDYSLDCIKMRTAYYLAKCGQPLTLFNDTIELQICNGNPNLEDKEKIFSPPEAIEKMIEAITQTITQQIDQHLQQANSIGLMIDDTTDVNTTKRVNVYFRCVKEGKPIIYFGDTLMVTDGKPDTLIAELMKLCASMGIDSGKISSFSSDGSSIITTPTTGVIARLRSKYNPHLINLHSINNRVSLAPIQACRDDPHFGNYQSILKDIIKYYISTPEMHNDRLKQFNDILDSNTQRICLKEPESYKWFTFPNAVDVVFKSFIPLCTALARQASNGCYEAKSLASRVCDVTFLLTTAFFVDVLPVTARLSEVIVQGVDLDSILPAVQSTIDGLGKFRENLGEVLEKVSDELSENEFTYRGVTLRGNRSDQNAFFDTTQNYLDILINNYRTKYNPDALKIITSLHKIFDASHIPRGAGSSYLCKHCKYELDILCNLLGSPAMITKPDVKGPVSVPPVIDKERIQKDFNPFKQTLFQMRHMKQQQILNKIVKDKNIKQMFPDFTKLAEIYLTCPLTHLDVESETFNGGKRLKVKNGSSLKPELESKILTIMKEGPSLEDFDATAAVAIFNKM